MNLINGLHSLKFTTFSPSCNTAFSFPGVFLATEAWPWIMQLRLVHLVAFSLACAIKLRALPTVHHLHKCTLCTCNSLQINVSLMFQISLKIYSCNMSKQSFKHKHVFNLLCTYRQNSRKTNIKEIKGSLLWSSMLARTPHYSSYTVIYWTLKKEFF